VAGGGPAGVSSPRADLRGGGGKERERGGSRREWRCCRRVREHKGREWSGAACGELGEGAAARSVRSRAHREGEGTTRCTKRRRRKSSYGIGDLATCLLYHVSAILTIRSRMDGQEQLGRVREPKTAHNYLSLIFFFFFFHLKHPCEVTVKYNILNTQYTFEI
jgi:hypothetical protein